MNDTNATPLPNLCATLVDSEFVGEAWPGVSPGKDPALCESVEMAPFGRGRGSQPSGLHPYFHSRTVRD